MDVVRSWVGAVTVEQNELGPPLLEEMNCGLYFMSGAHSVEKLMVCSLAELIDQRQVGQIGRTTL